MLTMWWYSMGNSMIPLMEEILHQLIGSLSLHLKWYRISSINSIKYHQMLFLALNCAQPHLLVPPPLLITGCTGQF